MRSFVFGVLALGSLMILGCGKPTAEKRDIVPEATPAEGIRPRHEVDREGPAGPAGTVPPDEWNKGQAGFERSNAAGKDAEAPKAADKAAPSDNKKEPEEAENKQ